MLQTFFFSLALQNLNLFVLHCHTGSPMNKEKLAKHRTLNGDEIQETHFGRVRLFVLYLLNVIICDTFFMHIFTTMFCLVFCIALSLFKIFTNVILSLQILVIMRSNMQQIFYDCIGISPI